MVDLKKQRYLSFQAFSRRLTNKFPSVFPTILKNTNSGIYVSFTTVVPCTIEHFMDL